jgi:DNA-binding MarR family transcriptional regulator
MDVIKSPILETFIKDLDTFVHEPVRLGILMLLHIHKSMPFSNLQKALRVTPGNLNSHIKKLATKGYVAIEKYFLDLRPRTVIKITKNGKEVLLNYTKKFKEILVNVEDN